MCSLRTGVRGEADAGHVLLGSLQKRKQLGAELRVVEDLRVSGELVEVLRTELAAADRLSTSLGQLCLVLAQRLMSRGETGSGVAALSRQLVAVRKEALADAEPAADPLEELRRRVDVKRAAAESGPGG
jgi:hypothetical protein